MKITFLGTGGAFSPQYGSSAAIVETGAGTHTLIDAGCTTYRDLCRTQTIEQITDVLITHLHDDHVGSLGSLINHRFHVSNVLVRLHFPPWLRDPLITLLNLQRTNAPLENYVSLDEIAADGTKIGTTTVRAVDTSGLHQANMPSSAYVLRGADLTIAYSGDLGDPDILFEALKDEDRTRTIVFHDASFEDRSTTSHVYCKQLEPHLDAGWRIYIYHNDSAAKPPDCRLPLVAEQPEFAPPSTD